MSPIYWNSSNNVGNRLIDDQHKEWIRLFNRLEENMLSKQSVQPKQFKLSLLKELLDFMTDHFTTEEQLMDQYDYPNIVQHRRMHKDFEARMYEKYRAVMAEEVVLNSELMALIRDWFVQHTGSEDKKTFTYINSSIDTNTTPDSLLQK